MHDALGHGLGAGAHIDNQQQFALRVHGGPHPRRCALQALNGLVLAEVAVFDCPQHGVELIEVHLLDVHLAQEIGGKGPQVLRRFHQPVQDRLRVDLEHPRRGPNAQALSQTRQHAHDQLHSALFTMKDRAVMLGKIAFAGRVPDRCG